MNAMTSETPCLSGCLTTRGRGGDVISHSPNCPNAPKPAALASCGCRDRVDIPHALNCHENVKDAQPVEPPACICGKPGCEGTHVRPEPQSEQPIDWEAADEWAAKAHPGIDRGEYELARAYRTRQAQFLADYKLGGTIDALKAERDALGMRVGKLLSAVAGEEGRRADLEAENAELRGRVERYEDLLVRYAKTTMPNAEEWTDDLRREVENEGRDIIRARRQEASNGK